MIKYPIGVQSFEKILEDGFYCTIDIQTHERLVSTKTIFL